MAKQITAGAVKTLKAFTAGRFQYPIHQEAFAFLKTCKTKYDFTSVGPITPTKDGIIPPRKILKLAEQQGFYLTNFSEIKGVSRGSPATLSAGINFFTRHGVMCREDNVSFAPDVLSAVNTVYKGRRGKVILPTPTFGYYFRFFQELGIDVILLQTKKEDNFLPSPETLSQILAKESGITSVLFCTPGNPTGGIISQSLASEIIDVTRPYGVMVVSDEAFGNSSNAILPFAKVSLKDTITVSSFSKSMQSGRHALCVGDPAIIEVFERLGGYEELPQKRAILAIEDSEENLEYFAKCDAFYRKNIELVNEKLSELNDKFQSIFKEDRLFVKPLILNPDIPNMYILDFSGLLGKKYGEKIIETGLDVAKWLAEEAGVGTVPGECFEFEPSSILVRMALNVTQKELMEALDSIISAADKIKKPHTIPSTNTTERLDGEKQKSAKHIL